MKFKGETTTELKNFIVLAKNNTARMLELITGRSSSLMIQNYFCKAKVLITNTPTPTPLDRMGW